MEQTQRQNPTKKYRSATKTTIKQVNTFTGAYKPGTKDFERLVKKKWQMPWKNPLQVLTIATSRG